MMYSLCVVSLDINSNASDRYFIAFLKMCTYAYIKKYGTLQTRAE